MNKGRVAYRTKEVAELIGVTERTVLAWIHRGEIESFKIGKLWFIPAESLAGKANDDIASHE